MPLIKGGDMCNKIIVIFCCLLLTCFFSLFIGCNKNKDETRIEARKKLNEIGIEFNNESFSKAFESGDIIVIKLLIRAGIDVNADLSLKGNRKPIFVAVEKGNIDIVKELISAGADVNVLDNFGSTPLISALIYGNVEIAKELISAGTDVNIKGKMGTNALNMAASKGYVEIVSMLLDNGANVLAEGYGGNNAIMESKDKEINNMLKKAAINKYEEILGYWESTDNSELRWNNMIFSWNGYLEQDTSIRSINRLAFLKDGILLINNTKKIKYNFVVGTNFINFIFDDNEKYQMRFKIANNYIFFKYQSGKLKYRELLYGISKFIRSSKTSNNNLHDIKQRIVGCWKRSDNDFREMSSSKNNYAFIILSEIPSNSVKGDISEINQYRKISGKYKIMEIKDNILEISIYYENDMQRSKWLLIISSDGTKMVQLYLGDEGHVSDDNMNKHSWILAEKYSSNIESYNLNDKMIVINKNWVSYYADDSGRRYLYNADTIMKNKNNHYEILTWSSNDGAELSYNPFEIMSIIEFDCTLKSYNFKELKFIRYNYEKYQWEHTPIINKTGDSEWRPIFDDTENRKDDIIKLHKSICTQ